MRNKSVRSQCKTNIVKAERFIFAGELESAQAAVAEAVGSLDRAAEKGIIHPNNAARRKARLMKKLNGLVTSSVGKGSAPASKEGAEES
jgi:small subunit ribosomal protein S20